MPNLDYDPIVIPNDRPIRVGMVGCGFMAKAHTHAWRNAPQFFDTGSVELVSIAGQSADEGKSAAVVLGWQSHSASVEELISRADIDVVDICTPNHTHREIAMRALAAGKHVLCEKPIALDVIDSEAMAAAAHQSALSGVFAAVGFNYRRVPALALARNLIADGEIGEVLHASVDFLQDWLLDPEYPITWRLDPQIAGSGPIADLGAHAVDIVQHLTGQHFASVVATAGRLVKERPVASSSTGLIATHAGEYGPVEVEDYNSVLGILDGGAHVQLTLSRVAAGMKCALRIMIFGSKGALEFDFERMNELNVRRYPARASGAVAERILVTEDDHPYAGSWWSPGHPLGYEHTHVHQVADFVRAIRAGRQPTPSFDEGHQVQRVLAAVSSSIRSTGWASLTEDVGQAAATGGSR